MDKAKGELLKVRKKSQRKKPTEKYEDKEKQVKWSILMFTAKILFKYYFNFYLLIIYVIANCHWKTL